MDRNQIIGMVVMLILMTVYFQFFAPETPEPIVEENTEQTTTTGAVENNGSVQERPQEITQVDDSLANEIQKERYGIFAQFANGTQEDVVIENKDVVITLSNKGGVVKSVLLKAYLTFDKKPLVLLDENSSTTSLLLTSNYKPVNVSELYYQTDVRKGDTTTVSFVAQLADGRYIEHKYKLGQSGFQLRYEINLVGLDGIIDNADAQFTWNDDIKKVEHVLTESRIKTTVNYMLVDGDVDDIGTGDDLEPETISTPIKWFAFKQKFFTAGLIADNQFSSAVYSTYADEKDTSYVKKATANVVIPIGDLKTGKGGFRYYFGPNNYQITKKVTPGFGENVDLGWVVFRFVNKFLIIPVFNFFENYISNYGIIIILLVFVIRLILAPLTYTSHMSMAKMKVLKPEIDGIKEKNEKSGADATKTQQDTMALYQKAGVNPLSGCIPMLLQFPFLLAMFNFFPNSIELRQEAFLWAHDLSTYDSIWDMPFTIPYYGDHVSLFTLLMTISTLILTWSNSQMNTQMQGPMKSMQYIMPVMFLFFLNSYSAGLTFYYFISNVVSFGQTALFRKLVDEDKIKIVMEENRKKNANKKKSKFQQKISDAMKVSEQTRKDKKKK